MDIVLGVSLSPTAVLARTQRLIRDGYILGFEARLNPAKLDSGMTVFVEVLLDRTTPNIFDAFNAAASVTNTRPAIDLTGTAARTRLVEVADAVSGRYALIADPVELTQMLAGQRGGAWTRTGYAIDTFSDTAQFNVISLAQPVCRARLAVGRAFSYSASVEECKAFAANLGWAVDGMTFLATLPTGPVCPVGSGPVYEFVRPDALGYNLRTMWDAVEASRMVEAGWTQSRIAFCVPQ